MTEEQSPWRHVGVRIVVDDLKRVVAPPRQGLQLLMALRSVDVAFFLNGVSSVKSLAKGGMVLINAEDDLRFDSTTATKILSITLSGEVVSRAAISMSIPTGSEAALTVIKTRVGFMDVALAGLLRSLKSSLNDPVGLFGIKSMLLGQVVALHLLGAECLRGGRYVWRSGGLEDAQVECLQRYVERNLDGDLRDEVLAGLVGVPVAALRRRFKASVGRTPREYVINERIRRAVDLLTETRGSISEIAHQCGFSDHSHMCVMFRRHVGQSPGQVRKGV